MRWKEQEKKEKNLANIFDNPKKRETVDWQNAE